MGGEKENLENLLCDDVQYDLMDLIVPGFSLRYLPRIMKEKDKIVRNHETGILFVYNTIQVALYSPILYNMFS